MQGQEAIFSFKVLKSSAYKDARALQVKKKMVSQTQKLPIVQYWYRYRLRLQGKASIGFGIEFEKIWQSANIRFRTLTNVYRPTHFKGAWLNLMVINSPSEKCDDVEVENGRLGDDSNNGRKAEEPMVQYLKNM